MPTSPHQINKVVLGFSNLATCGAVQGSFMRHNKYKIPHHHFKHWKNILIYGDPFRVSPVIIWVGCN